jgi:hypothetical protein
MNAARYADCKLRKDRELKTRFITAQSCAIAQAPNFALQRPGLDPMSGHVQFVVDEMALG